MDERLLGSSGTPITRIILGCGNFGGIGSSPAFFDQGTSKPDAFRLLDTAWDVGRRATHLVRYPSAGSRTSAER